MRCVFLKLESKKLKKWGWMYGCWSRWTFEKRARTYCMECYFLTFRFIFGGMFRPGAILRSYRHWSPAVPLRWRQPGTESVIHEGTPVLICLARIPTRVWVVPNNRATEQTTLGHTNWITGPQSRDQGPTCWLAVLRCGHKYLWG